MTDESLPLVTTDDTGSEFRAMSSRSQPESVVPCCSRTDVASRVGEYWRQVDPNLGANVDKGLMTRP